LYYKKDRKISFNNPNYNKYLKKNHLYYTINDRDFLYVVIIYSNKYKYIMNCNYNIDKFTLPQILISNKYELDYYCKFFNIY
jgi:hypothetical protein